MLGRDYWIISLAVPVLLYLYGQPITDFVVGTCLGLVSRACIALVGTPQEASLGSLQGVLGVDRDFDYVVVGGGTAGNVLGSRLAEAGFRVAIIEAGPYFDASKDGVHNVPAADALNLGISKHAFIPQLDWRIQTEPQVGAANRRLHISRGKCLGGTSALNGMVYQRPSSQAYDAWAEAVGDDSYRREFFQEYFKKSVNFTTPNHSKRLSNATTPDDASDFALDGKGGPVQVGFSNWVSPWTTWFEKALVSSGILNTLGSDRGDLLGYHYTRTTIRASDSTRSTSVQYILRAIKEKIQTLKVFTKTRATKVVCDNKKRAVGVKVVSGGVEHTIKAAKEVIVSAGAFHSPQLLMLSGIGPAKTLEQFGIPVRVSLPGVGQDMWDHIMFGPSYEVTTPTIGTVFSRPYKLPWLVKQYKKNRDGPLTSNNVELIAWEKLPAEYRAQFSTKTEQDLGKFPKDWPEVEYMSAPLFAGTMAFPILQQPLNGKYYATILGVLNAPVSRGNVTLKSASAFDQPAVNPNWFTDEADRQLAVATYRRMRDIWKTAELQAVTVGKEYWPGEKIESDEQILQLIEKSLTTVWHPACTCKMGKKDDTMAVVDSKARVYGVRGLRVVDASAFPILPPGHPQSTVYGLAEKMADSIIRG